MTRTRLIRNIAYAIAQIEGALLTKEECKAKHLRWPPLAQRNANPGNIRSWGKPSYPTKSGYVDFTQWAKDRNLSTDRAWNEGWRVLEVLVGQYIRGKYTGGKSPTLIEMFKVYAPSSDGNKPDKYAKFVASWVGVDADVPLARLIEE